MIVIVPFETVSFRVKVAPLPLALDGVTVKVVWVVTEVGIPVTAPVLVLKDKPAGSVAGLIANAVAVDPL